MEKMDEDFNKNQDQFNTREDYKKRSKFSGVFSRRILEKGDNRKSHKKGYKCHEENKKNREIFEDPINFYRRDENHRRPEIHQSREDSEHDRRHRDFQPYEDEQRHEDQQLPENQQRSENLEHPEDQQRYEDQQRTEDQQRYADQERPESQEDPEDQQRYEDRKRPENQEDPEAQQRYEDQQRLENQEDPENQQRYVDQQRPENQEDHEDQQRYEDQERAENQEDPEYQQRYEDLKRPESQEDPEAQQRYEDQQRPEDQQRYEDQQHHENYHLKNNQRDIDLRDYETQNYHSNEDYAIEEYPEVDECLEAENINLRLKKCGELQKHDQIEKENNSLKHEISQSQTSEDYQSDETSKLDEAPKAYKLAEIHLFFQITNGTRQANKSSESRNITNINFNLSSEFGDYQRGETPKVSDAYKIISSLVRTVTEVQRITKDNKSKSRNIQKVESDKSGGNYQRGETPEKREAYKTSETTSRIRESGETAGAELQHNGNASQDLPKSHNKLDENNRRGVEEVYQTREKRAIEDVNANDAQNSRIPKGQVIESRRGEETFSRSLGVDENHKVQRRDLSHEIEASHETRDSNKTGGLTKKSDETLLAGNETFEVKRFHKRASYEIQTENSVGNNYGFVKSQTGGELQRNDVQETQSGNETHATRGYYSTRGNTDNESQRGNKDEAEARNSYDDETQRGVNGTDESRRRSEAYRTEESQRSEESEQDDQLERSNQAQRSVDEVEETSQSEQADNVPGDLDDAASVVVVWRTNERINSARRSSPPRDTLLEVESSDGSQSVEELEHRNFWRLKHTPAEIRRTQAINMKKYMDHKTDPCEDFYQYACGNWHRYNPIPADRSSFDTFEMLRESLDSVLRDLLEENVPNEPVFIDRSYWVNLKPIHTTRDKRHVYDFYKIAEQREVPSPFYQVILNHSFPQPTDAIIKAKFLFKSCMNEELIKIRGVKPLLYLIKELGGWPILETKWEDKSFDFEWLLGQLRLYNNDIIISEWVGPDIRNSEENVIQIDQSTLGLPSRDYFIEKGNRKFVDAYKHFIETIAVLLGADPTVAYEDAEDIVNFEIELSAITVSAEHRKNVSDIYVRLKLRELHSIIPQIDWFKYIGIITNKKPNPEDPIVTFSLNYLHRLVGLLSATRPRITANYLLWRFIRHRVNNLDDRFQDAKQRFYKVLFGREQSPARWQSCISQVNSNLGMALGNLFVRRYFDERSKNDTLQMTIQLRQSFKELLMETEWLDIDTKKAAALKIDYMRLKIGYPNYILTEAALDRRYQDVRIHPDFYFENTLSILQHLTRLEHSKLSIAVDKNFWNSPPAVVNAYYSRNKNQIMFPAGILQPPFYHRHFPRSLNYGGIGVVIGHEMTHGFDDKGRLFDKDGNLKVWWKKESIEEFHERSKCLIEQYNAYIVPEANMQMDGANTQGENIADNGGIKQAFRAYRHWAKQRQQIDETLPGLNLTGVQLFFLNFAQIWCGTTRPEAARNKLRTAVHSPGRFRVIGTLSNSDEFAKVYKCPVGAPMNPKAKCKIW